MVVAIAPDRPAGEMFLKVLQKGLDPLGFDVRLEVVKIAPRIEGDQLTNAPEKVSRDLARSLVNVWQGGADFITISCNTLSLPVFLDAAVEIAREQEPRLRKAQLVTTIGAVKEMYSQKGVRHLWLGTTSTCSFLSRDGFDTLEVLGHPEAQSLVQEIIWRVKAITGSDVSSAEKYLGKNLRSREELEKSMQKLGSILRRLNRHRVILGCTELPLAFCWHPLKGIEGIDPASAVAAVISRRRLR